MYSCATNDHSCKWSLIYNFYSLILISRLLIKMNCFYAPSLSLDSSCFKWKRKLSALSLPQLPCKNMGHLGRKKRNHE